MPNEHSVARGDSRLATRSPCTRKLDRDESRRCYRQPVKVCSDDDTYKTEMM